MQNEKIMIRFVSVRFLGWGGREGRWRKMDESCPVLSCSALPPHDQKKKKKERNRKRRGEKRRKSESSNLICSALLCSTLL